MKTKVFLQRVQEFGVEEVQPLHVVWHWGVPTIPCWVAAERDVCVVRVNEIWIGPVDEIQISTGWSSSRL